MSLCLRVPAGRLSSRRAKMSGSARPRQSARPRDNPSQRTCNNARTRTCDNANSEQSCELVQGNAHDQTTYSTIARGFWMASWRRGRVGIGFLNNEPRGRDRGVACGTKTLIHGDDQPVSATRNRPGAPMNCTYCKVRQNAVQEFEESD